MKKYTVHYQIAGKKFKTTVNAITGKNARLKVAESLKFTDIQEADEFHLFRELEKKSGLKIMS